MTMTTQTTIAASANRDARCNRIPVTTSVKYPIAQAVPVRAFYEAHTDKAKALVAQQILEGWTFEECRQYFFALGYDYFFVQAIVNPLFINP